MLAEVRFFLLLFATLLLACGSPSRDVLVRSLDGGADTGDALDGALRDARNEADPGLGGTCIDDPQCDDKVACTFDLCDPVLHRCRSIPDDSRCDDGTYCNGRERCVLLHGCTSGPVVTCQDGTACTIDTCIEASKSCEHAPRDADHDGDPDDHCPPGRDCNDTDPFVSSSHAEVCSNANDDNCDGRIDEAACVAPQDDTCAAAFALGGPATYLLSTVGAKRDYTASCSVATPSAAHDVVATVTVPPGAPRDLDLWATTTGSEVALAVFGTCGQASTEISCGAGGSATARTRARSLQPGTYAIVVTTQIEAELELQVNLLPPAPTATNEACALPASITIDQPFTVELIDAAKDLPSVCAPPTGELTYTFTLGSPADVRVFSSVARGDGVPLVGLRTSACTTLGDELRCQSSNALPLYARALQAGTYIVTVAATAPIDASVIVKTYAPTTAPPDQFCATAPPAQINAPPTPLSLANHEDAIKDGCNPGHPNAALSLSLAVPSDVMVVGRFPGNEVGSVALDMPSCGASDNLVCEKGQTPVRIDRRNVPAGDYRVVVSDQLAENDTVSVLVRPTVPPTLVGAQGDTCASPAEIPETGGYFSGDTTGLAADFDDGCDTPSSTGGGAPDQVLRLVLSQPRRVVFNMDGSVYTTILDIRQGATCPGQEVPGACYVGFTGARSFLDLSLQAGTYWVVIDGYAGGQGAWSLDVRVLPP